MQSDDGSNQQRRSILITGAASGIGLATARLFATKGWFIGAFDVNAASLDSLQHELGEKSGLFRRLDVTDRAALLAAVGEFALATGGTLDLLFNNAGIDVKGPFEKEAWERILAVVDVNLVGALSLIHATIPLLKATPGSLCLSTSSASAIFGAANMAVYSATKHAVKGLTEALSVELSASGVRVADLIPGIVDTGMLAPDQKAKLPKEGLWRVLSAESIAAVAWAAYAGDRVHWYAPDELANYDIEITRAPELARDRRIAGKL